MKKNQKGFTIVELVIVIVVIGVLSAIVVPKMGDVTTSANQAQEKANVKVLKSAHAIAYGKQAMSNPSDPYPTLSELAATAEGTSIAANYSGICLAPGKKISTYSDTSGSTVTTSTTAVARSIGNHVEVDETNC